MNLLIARKNIGIIKSAFYICPIVDDALGKAATKDKGKIEWWE